jgi:hypothetical protein
MKDWLPPPGAVSRKRPNQKWGEGREKCRAEEWTVRVIDEIFTSRRDWGMGYEAGFVRRGGVGADTVFGNSWSWKGE